ncbi:mitochondrial carrier protein [Mycena latifolia]|nr:mitochondrial carrier protein [Mycena latifolia]
MFWDRHIWYCQLTAIGQYLGITELLIFHPFDTVAKRLMSNKAKVRIIHLFLREKSNKWADLMGHHEPDPLPRSRNGLTAEKVPLAVPGLGYAVGYKVAQRPLQWLNDLITRHYKPQFTNAFGERKSKMMMQAMASRCVLCCRVNPEAFTEEGTILYRGWGWTVARNAPGSFALFGASTVTKEYVLGIKDYSSATWTQNFIVSESIAGAMCIQNVNFENKVTGL